VSVIRLIAGISIVDALFASSVLGPAALVIGPLGAFSTLALQRIARGT
jgi:hypothetical protein